MPGRLGQGRQPMMLLGFSPRIPQLVCIVLTLVSNLTCPTSLQGWLIVVVDE